MFSPQFLQFVQNHYLLFVASISFYHFNTAILPLLSIRHTASSVACVRRASVFSILRNKDNFKFKMYRKAALTRGRTNQCFPLLNLNFDLRCWPTSWTYIRSRWITLPIIYLRLKGQRSFHSKVMVETHRQTHRADRSSHYRTQKCLAMNDKVIVITVWEKALQTRRRGIYRDVNRVGRSDECQSHSIVYC